MPYRVRQAILGDAEAIHQIWLAGAEKSFGVSPARHGGIDYREYFQCRLAAQDDVFRFFVVENSGGQVVSWQSLSPMRKHPAVAETMAELSAYTSPRHAGGRATLLGLTATFRFADTSPLHYVLAFITTHNSPALRLAAHLGMHPVGVFPPVLRAPDLPPLTCLAYPCGSARGAHEERLIPESRVVSGGARAGSA